MSETSGVDGLERLDDMAAVLEEFTKLVQEELVAPAEAALLSLIPALAEYPPPPAPIQGTAVNPVRFTTRAGQQVNFFARRREPYRRTGTLGRLWTTAPPVFRSLKSGWRISIGNRTPYAKWVQGRDTQASIHQGRWQTAEDVIEQNEDRITEYIMAGIERLATRIEEQE